MALGAILNHDVQQPACHDETRQSRRGAPVDIHAPGDIVVVGLEVDEAAVAAGPVGGEAVAGLVGAKCLGEDDVDEPDGVEGLEGAEEGVLDEGSEGGGFEPVEEGVDALMGAGRFFLGVLGNGDGAPMAFEAGADAAEGVAVGVGGDVGEAPDHEFEGEEAEGDDDVD